MKKHAALWLSAMSLCGLLAHAPAASAAQSPVARSMRIALPNAGFINIDLPGLRRSGGSSSAQSSVASSSSRSSERSSPVSSASSSSARSAASSSVAPGSPASSDLTSIRRRIITMVNDVRRQNGMPALTEESHLTAAAQTHAEDMQKRGYYSHNTPEGKSPTTQIRDAGYPLRGTWYTAQNIARGQETPEQVMADWMNSSGHRKNILSGNFKDIGIGFYKNHWVQNFGSHSI